MPACDAEGVTQQTLQGKCTLILDTESDTESSASITLRKVSTTIQVLVYSMIRIFHWLLRSLIEIK